MTDLDPNLTSEDYQLDFTDVAVMVRSSSQMDLFKEALATYWVLWLGIKATGIVKKSFCL